MKYKVTIELTDGTTRAIYERASTREALEDIIWLNKTIDPMYVDFKRVINIEETNWEEPEALEEEEKCPNCIKIEKKIKELEREIRDLEIPF